MAKNSEKKEKKEREPNNKKLFEVSDYEIYGSSFCFTLSCKNGQSRYYSSMTSLLQALLREKISKADSRDIESLKNKIDDAMKEIEKACAIAKM